VFIFSTVTACAFNIGAANCHSYAALIVVRVIGAFFVSPPAALGAGVVREMFFAKQRGEKMGVWT
jgi:MFS family permease